MSQSSDVSLSTSTSDIVNRNHCRFDEIRLNIKSGTIGPLNARLSNCLFFSSSVCEFDSLTQKQWPTINPSFSILAVSPVINHRRMMNSRNSCGQAWSNYEAFLFSPRPNEANFDKAEICSPTYSAQVSSLLNFVLHHEQDYILQLR